VLRRRRGAFWAWYSCVDRKRRPDSEAVTDDSELAGLDPFDIFDFEAARLERFFASLGDEDPTWSRPSRCEGWLVRDVLAHLLGSEEYHHACLAGTVSQHGSVAPEDVAGIAAANEAGIRALDGRGPSELAAQWHKANGETRRGFRARGDGTVDTSIGDYPCRWQAFHLAGELAVHADDIGVPVTTEEGGTRRDWRARFSRFALLEAKPQLDVSAAGSDTRVRGDGIEVTVGDEELVEAVAGRLGPESALDAAARALLDTMP
jgi:uncharacterized protein (TIGR03083 family)